MFGTRSTDHRGWQQLTADSWDAGWRALSVRSYIQNDVVDTIIPANGEQKITMLVGGHKMTAVERDGRWHTADIRAGSISMTVSGRPTRIRWQSLSAEPLRHIAVHLPHTTMLRVAAELWDTNPTTSMMPDALDATDPLLPAFLPVLARAAAHGAGDLYAQSAAEYLAVHVLAHHGRKPRTPRPRIDDHRILGAQALIRDRIRTGVSLPELAAVAGLSPYYFLRLFHQQTGQSPHQRLVDERMRAARALLANGREPVGEVAAQVGYGTSTQFARAFRQHHGCTPSEFRRRFR